MKQTSVFYLFPDYPGSQIPERRKTEEGSGRPFLSLGPVTQGISAREVESYRHFTFLYTKILPRPQDTDYRKGYTANKLENRNHRKQKPTVGSLVERKIVKDGERSMS